jgi:hypothetical protein
MNDYQKKLMEQANLSQKKSDPRTFTNGSHTVTWTSDNRAIFDTTHLTGHNITDRLKKISGS